MRQEQERTRIHIRRAGMRAARLALLGLPVASLAACSVERKDASGEEAAQTRGQVSAVATQPASVSPTTTPAATEISAIPANVTYGDAEKVFRSGDYKAAADMFDVYSGRVPTNPWGPYMAGISAWRAGDHTRAESALKRTVEMDPKHIKGQLNLARVLLEENKASDALDFATKVVELNPELGEGWRVLGNVRAELRMTDAAVEAYRRAILVDHRDAWTMNNLGILMINEGKYADALGPLARATELQPNVAVFQNNLGVALERSGHFGQSVEAFRAALVADSMYAKARVSLERLSRVQASEEEKLVLSEIATAFQDEVERWKGEVPTLTAEPKPVETTMQPVDTTMVVPVQPVETMVPVPTPTPGAPF